MRTLHPIFENFRSRIFQGDPVLKKKIEEMKKEEEHHGKRRNVSAEDK
jgi:hypothetical protein